MCFACNKSNNKKPQGDGGVMDHINLTYLQIKECYTNMQEHIMKNQWIFSRKKVTFSIFSKTLEINGVF
jgi:hypothetical protein